MAQLKTPPPPELVTVTVDGREMKLPKGKNLLQALLDAGVYIPHYCYQPALSVAGNCRLCLVEVVGRPKPEVSCNMIVTDKLAINVSSPVVEDCRKGMMEFLLVNHPLDCPICDRGGECMLQRYSVEYGWGTARTTDDRRRFMKPQFDPLIDIERNRCIMCTRCVRFCDEVASEHVLGVFGHGSRDYIGTFGNGPVANVFSGNVIDLCPVGCLTSKPFRFEARAWELRQTPTTTRTCNGPVTAWTRGGRLYRVTPPVRKRFGAFTINEDTSIFISNEARFGSYHVNNEERLLTPLVRKGGRLAEASWTEALGAAADALRACGAGEACFLAGERSTNEEFFALSRLAREVCRSPIDWRMRFTSEAAAQAAGAALAAADGDFDLLEKKAYGSTILINADLLGSAPDAVLPIKLAAQNGKTRLGLIDARLDPWLAKHAAAMCLERPADLAGALETLAVALEAAKTAGAPGEAPEGYEKIFKLLSVEQGLVVLGLDTAGGALNAALVPAALRLMRALGPGWHFLPATAARNARGAFHSGAQAGLEAGGDGESKSAAPSGAPHPAAPQPAAPHTAAPGLLRQAAEGKFKVLFLHRADELTTHPQRALIEKAIAATPTVIAVDFFPSWITERAVVVLPGTSFYETNGSMTDIDGTLQRMTRTGRPAGGAQEEWRIIESLAGLLGAEPRESAEELFAALLRAWGAPRVFRLDDLNRQGPGPESPQVAHPHLSYRTRPAFKLAPGRRPDPAALDFDGGSPEAITPKAGAGEIPLLWIHHAQGADHLGSRSTEFDALRPQPRVELSPADAARLGLAEGDWAAIEAADVPAPARAASRVRVSELVAFGAAFGAANVLGLTIGADVAGIPIIKLHKTEPPLPREGEPAEAVEVNA